MKEKIIVIIKNILTNVLTALYQPLGFAVILAVLFMFLYLYAREHVWKEAAGAWWSAFKADSLFRKLFALAFYTAILLFRTLLNRDIWANPLSDVIGVWGLYNANGQFTTEAIENVLLFIPFIVLIIWCMGEGLFGKRLSLGPVLWKSVEIAFLCSLAIECLQLFFRIGTFQLSDLFDNVLGGAIGGMIYWIGYKVKDHGKPL